MKIVITSQTGRIGKTCLAANAFLPFMPEGTKFMSIESMNDGAEQFGVELEKQRGSETQAILTQVMMEDHVLLDVGASNFEEFFVGLGEFGGAENDFDRFVIPVVPGNREPIEAMKTAAILESFGVPPEKIHFVFNRVVYKSVNSLGSESVKEQFREILDFAKRKKSWVANPECHMRECALFVLLANRKATLAEALVDDTDFAAALRAAKGDPAEQKRVSDAWAAMRLANVVAADCQRIFDLVTEGL